MKKPALILLASLALAGATFAQDTNAAQLALAREVIAAMHADKMFDGMAAQMKQMSAQAANSAMPADATPAQREKAQQLQGKIMDLSLDAAKGLLVQMDQLYAEVYSEAELKAMKAFFGSPEGQSMLAKQPQVMQKLMPFVQQMQQDLMPKIQQLVEEAKADIEKDAAKPEAAPAK